MSVCIQIACMHTTCSQDPLDLRPTAARPWSGCAPSDPPAPPHVNGGLCRVRFAPCRTPHTPGAHRTQQAPWRRAGSRRTAGTSRCCSPACWQTYDARTRTCPTTCRPIRHAAAVAAADGAPRRPAPRRTLCRTRHPVPYSRHRVPGRLQGRDPRWRLSQAAMWRPGAVAGRTATTCCRTSELDSG